MRFAFLVPGSLIVCAVAMYACSSSDEPTAGPDAGKTSSSSTSSSTSGSTGDDDDDNGGSTTSSSGGGGGDGGGGGGGDGGGGGGGDGGGSTSGAPVDGGSAGTLCVTGSVQEVEPNNSAGAAQVIPATTGNSSMKFCGRITDATDVDFITYTFNATGMITIAGASANTGNNLKIFLSVDGGAEQEFTGALPLQPGKPYLFRVTASGASDYRFNLDVTQN